MLRQTITFILCGVVLTVTTHAQYRAGLQGVVTDPNGAVVPNASVKLTSKESNAVRTATTSNDGVYTITGLAPGLYELSVSAEGFSNKILTSVRVTAEQMQSVPVELEVGAVTQSVTVEGQVNQLIDTETAMIGSTMTDKEIEYLPTFARDPFQLLRLAPGVFGNGAQDGSGGGFQLPGSNIGGSGATSSIFSVENGPQVFANGTRQNSNDIQVDGVGVNSASWGGAAVITPNEESVKEVRIIANNYSAEYGRTSGAQILVVSQNGTNEYHGSGFFKWHRPGLNAFQRWNGPGTPSPVLRDNNRFNQFGGSVGGPILKNKMFGFFSYETLRNRTRRLATAWYESPQFLQTAGRNGSIARQLLSYPGTEPSVGSVISLTCAQVGLPTTQCRDAGGLDLGSPLTTALGTRDPSFGQSATPFGIGNGFDGLPDAMQIQTVAPRTETNVQYNFRVDFQATSNDLIAFSGYFVPVKNQDYNGPQRAANLFNHEQLSQAWTAIYTRTFSPTLINEFRFGLSGWDWNEFDSNPQIAWGLPTASFDTIGSLQLQNFGAPGFSIFDQKTYNFRDTLTKVYNSHSLKFGADVSRVHFRDEAPWSARPTYTFRNLWDFANDAPYKENANFDPVSGSPTSVRKDLRFNIIGLFVQDDWKIRPNLTINLGLRWEYFSPLTEVNDKISNVLLGSGSDVLSGVRIRTGGSLFSTSKNNWGPQVGFAWSPKGFLGRELQDKLVVRGGFGIGYNLQQLAVTSNGRFNPPFQIDLNLFESNILYTVNSDINSYTGWPSNPNAIQTFDPSTGIPTSGAPINLTGFPDNMPSTTTYRYSLDVQYNVGRNWVATVGYQGSQSRHYTRQARMDWFFYPLSNPRVQNLSWYSNDTNAGYNALLTQVQHRFSSQFELDVQYRYSKSTDQGSHDYNIDPYPWDYSFSRGPSDFDVTHMFKLWGVWTPTIFRGGGWKEKVLGGWTLSGILTAHSGFPWTPEYCNTGGNVIYPNSGHNCLLPSAYAGGADSDSSNSTFMRPNGNFPNGALSYLTVPTYPTTGKYPAPAPNIHRNLFRGPGFLGNDFTIGKVFRLPRMKVLGENARLNLQANIYNAFNKLNLKPFSVSGQEASRRFSNDGLTSSPQFGQSQGALGARVVELQAKFRF